MYVGKVDMCLVNDEDEDEDDEVGLELVEVEL